MGDPNISKPPLLGFQDCIFRRCSSVCNFSFVLREWERIAENLDIMSGGNSNAAWKRPVSRICHYNLEVGENYYNPMTAYIDNKLTAEAPGALSFSERLHKKWIHGRTEYQSKKIATCTSYTRGF